MFDAHLIPLFSLPSSVVGWGGMILMFGVAVAIHELGHLLWAKAFGVGAEEFAIGFGKRLWSREWGGTVYSVRALPLGGFVKIKGMVAAMEEEEERRRREEQAKGEKMSLVRSAVYESSLAMKDLSLWKKLLVFGGGVVNNVILAFVCFISLAMFCGLEPFTPIPPVVGWVGGGSSAEAAGFERGDEILSVNGQPVNAFAAPAADDEFVGFANLIHDLDGPADVEVQRGDVTLALTWSDLPSEPEEWAEQLQDTTPPMIRFLYPNSPAERGGLREHDLILAVDGVEVEHWMDLQPLLAAASGEAVLLTVQRGEETFDVTMTPEFKDYVTSAGRWTIGFQPIHPLEIVESETVGAGEAVAWAVGRINYITVESYKFIWNALTFQISFQKVSDNVGGPVQILVLSYQSSTGGIRQFLWFAGLLNMILAVMNILPIPILDGGHCLINILETARRRPFSIRTLERVYTVFFALLITLFLVITTKDIVANLWRVTG